MFSDCGRYVFSVLACMGNMICLLGRDSMRLAIIPMKNETQMTPDEVSHILGKNSNKLLSLSRSAWLELIIKCF